MDRVRELKKSAGTNESEKNGAGVKSVDLNNNETEEQKQKKINEEKAEAKTFLINLLSNFKFYDTDSLKGI